jgi:hypothetical protein
MPVTISREHRKCGPHGADVRSSVGGRGLEVLGEKLGRALDELDREGIDVRQMTVTFDVESGHVWVADIRWPESAEPEDLS